MTTSKAERNYFTEDWGYDSGRDPGPPSQVPSRMMRPKYAYQATSRLRITYNGCEFAIYQSIAIVVLSSTGSCLEGVEL